MNSELYNETAEVLRRVRNREKSLRTLVFESHFETADGEAKEDEQNQSFVGANASHRVLEVGCGAGNTVFPLLEACPDPKQLFVYCCDFAPKAVDIVKAHSNYREDQCLAFVCDIVHMEQTTLPFPSESLDAISCIFVLSAIKPDQQSLAVHNMVKQLKPGGVLLFKDYGRYDMTQLRFKKERVIAGEDNLYARGDGTLVYYFTQDELDSLFVGAGLVKEQNVIDRRLINKKQLLRLCCATLKQRSFLEALLEEPDVADLLRDDAIAGYTELAWIVLYEFLLGAQGLKASRKILTAVGQRSKAIHQQRDLLVSNGRGPVEEGDAASAPPTIPRYARINTIKTDRSTILKQLGDDGYEIVDYSSKRISRNKYRTTVTSLREDQVLVDGDVPDLLVFSAGTDLHNSWMVADGHLILQDKASCLPAICLRPEPGSHVFDICAAPGMKTSHLAALLENNGKIWSIDKTRDRVETMNALLERSGVAIASVFCGDFLRTDVTDKNFKKVRYALVDPPCSGSGIIKRMDHITDEAPTDSYRLNSLGNLQAMILKHALKLPNLERLVYSTCSLYERENEAVIDEALQSPEVAERFELVKALPRWKHRGRKGFEFARMCLRSNPDKDLTNGFFVAVFQRKNCPATDE